MPKANGGRIPCKEMSEHDQIVFFTQWFILYALPTEVFVGALACKVVGSEPPRAKAFSSYLHLVDSPLLGAYYDVPEIVLWNLTEI